MDTNTKTVLATSLALILKPLVRIALRFGIPYGVFADIAKQTYVEVAAADFGLPDRKQSYSRISIITGLNRKEVTRIQNLPEGTEREIDESYNRAARVISGWVRDAEFSDGNSQPASLPLEGNSKSFTSLVRKYSGDMPVRALLDELIRVGAAHQKETGHLELINKAYVPEQGEEEKIGILGTDVADLIETISFNLQPDVEKTRLQLKVSYDNLPEWAVIEFQKMASDQSIKLLYEFDSWLSDKDRDLNPDIEGEGQYRIGVGIYYFEEASLG